MEGASDFVFCWAIESRVAQRVHTHTHTHTRTAFRSLCYYHRLLSISFGFRVGAQKRNGTKSFFFFFLLLYAASQQSFHNIISPLSLSDLSSIYAGIAVCVCVYWFLLSFRPQEGFSLWLTDFLFSSLHSRCVSLLDLSISLIIIKLHFASIYALDNWNFIFLSLSLPFLPLFDADTISPSNAFSRQKRSRPRCDAAGSHSRVLY
jgi:hypothetical protein